MSYETRDEIRHQNTMLKKELKNIRIENEKLRKRGVFNWIKNILNKGIPKNG